MLKHDVKVSSSYSSVLRRSGALARDVKNMDAPWNRRRLSSFQSIASQHAHPHLDYALDFVVFQKAVDSELSSLECSCPTEENQKKTQNQGRHLVVTTSRSRTAPRKALPFLSPSSFSSLFLSFPSLFPLLFFKTYLHTCKKPALAGRLLTRMEIVDLWRLTSLWKND